MTIKIVIPYNKIKYDMPYDALNIPPRCNMSVIIILPCAIVFIIRYLYCVSCRNTRQHNQLYLCRMRQSGLYAFEFQHVIKFGDQPPWVK